MAENQSREQHPLDPDPPPPPGAPDMDLDIPVGEDDAAPKPAGTEDTTGDAEAPEPPD